MSWQKLGEWQKVIVEKRGQTGNGGGSALGYILKYGDEDDKC
jgi:hypothetical protein